MMDLMSLPNEMLASVFKYSNNKSLKTVRRMNRRVDAIVKKNKFNLLSLDRLIIGCLLAYDQHNDDYVCVTMEPLQCFYDQKDAARISDSAIGQHTESELTNQVLEDIFKKVRKVRQLALHSFVVDAETVNIIRKHSKIIRGSALSLGPCKIVSSADSLKNLTNLAKLSAIQLSLCEFPDGNGLTDEILAGFNPSMNVVLYGGDTSRITIQSLRSRVHSNRLNLELHWTKSSITFQDMIDFLKTFKTIYNSMNFGTIQDVPSDLGEVESILEKEFGNVVIAAGDQITFLPSAKQGLAWFKPQYWR